MMLLTLALVLTALQGSTAQGLDSGRDAFVDAVGPDLPRDGWSIAQKTQFPLYPVAGEGVVVIGRVFDWTSSSGSALEAYELATGALLWSTNLASTAGMYDAPFAIRDGVVYASRTSPGLINANVHALDLRTGTPLWQSASPVQFHYWTSPVFLPGGDLIFNGRYVSGRGYKLLRIDHTDGSTVWNRGPGNGTTADLAGGAMHAGRFYLARAIGGRHAVARIDPDTGLRMYEAPPEGDGLNSSGSSNLLVTSDGLVLYPWGGNFLSQSDAALIAYDDTGTALVERWRSPLKPGLAESGFAVGPGGAIYSWSPADEVVRLDPATGAVVRRSAPLSFSVLHGRMVVDRQGKLFVVASTTGATPVELHVYSPELRPLWSRKLGVAPTVGPLLTEDGRLVVSTNAEVLRTFVDAGDPDAGAGSCAVGPRATARNGSGANNACFSAAGGPRLGRTWTATVDAAGHPGALLVGFVVGERPGAGLFLNVGELLIDPASRMVARRSAPAAGGAQVLSLSVPLDASLCGGRLTAQGWIAGGGAELCNALDLVIGG